MKIGLALLLDGLLAWALLRPHEVPAVHPLAPPLTRIAALGDRPVGGEGTPPSPGWRVALDRTIRAVGTPAQRQSLAGIQPPPSRPTDRRSPLQADAAAMAAVLGPARVAESVARTEERAAWVGEGRVWDELAP